MNTKYRILLYTHDGAGLGHLSRLSKVASEISSKKIHCLIVSGHREMTSIVPNNVDFVKLPNMDSMLLSKSEYWNREPFIEMDKKDVIEHRKTNIEKIVKLYKPHVLIVDYFPLGKHHELIKIVEKHKKIIFYNLQRGIIGSQDVIKNDILTPQNIEYLTKYFKNIFVVNDPAVFDFINNYQVPEQLRLKLISTGYIANKIPIKKKEEIRVLLGRDTKKKWIICTAGGGKLGESFIRQVLKLPDNFHDCQFDIIAGFKSNFKEKINDKKNLRFHNSLENLNEYIAAADICITTGGYNTITEAMINDTQLLIWPSQIEINDEQYLHAVSLKKSLMYDPLINNLEELIQKLQLLINSNIKFNLDNKINMKGLDIIKETIYSELKL